MSPTRHGAHPAPPNVGTATAAMRTPLPLCHPSRHLKVPFWGARALIFPIWLFLFSALQLLSPFGSLPLGHCSLGTGGRLGGGTWCPLPAPGTCPGTGIGAITASKHPAERGCPRRLRFWGKQQHRCHGEAPARHGCAKGQVPEQLGTSTCCWWSKGGKKEQGWAAGQMCPSTQARSAALLQLFQLPKAPRQPPPPLRHCAQISFGESPKPHAAEAPPACRSPAVAKSILQQLGGFAEGLCAPSCPSCSLKQPS